MTVPFVDFEVPIEIVVIGLVTGLVYAVLALGLTLIYRSTRVFNFAHADMGLTPATLMAVVGAEHGWPYPIALAAGLLTAVLIGVLVDFLVIRRLTEAPRLVVMVATIGVAQVLVALNYLLPRRDNAESLPFPTPFTAEVRIGELRLTQGELLILVVVPLIAVGLTLFFQRSRIGLASRAAAQNLEAARLAGVRARRVSSTMWVIVALLAGASAILLAPIRPITAPAELGPSLTGGALAGPALMLRGLGASLLGGLRSLPQVFAAGIGIGIVETLVVWNYPARGTAEVVLFVVIVASLLLRKGLAALGRGSDEGGWSLGTRIAALDPRLARLPQVRVARVAALLSILAVAAAAPMAASSAQQVLLASVALFALMGLSLVVLTGMAGQVSLGQFAFVAIGAAVGGRMNQLGYPWWVGVTAAMAAGAATAVVVGLPALRLRGLFLAVTTLGFAVAVGGWVLSQRWLVNVNGGMTSMFLPRQEWLGVDMRSELRYYWWCLGLLVLGAVAVAHLRRTGLGRAFMAVRDNEPGAATLSVNPRRVKLAAFAISGLVASAAGYFYGGLLVSFTDASLFSPENSLALVALVVFGGVTSITGAVLGALWVRGIPYLLGQDFGILSSGLGLVLMLQMLPGGLASLVFRIRDRLVPSLAGEAGRRAVAEGPAGRSPLPADDRSGGRGVVLSAEHVTVRFGGVSAVNDVSIVVHDGEIVGLVGPNGAGKTTLLDVLSGQVRPSEGHVRLLGHDLGGLRPEHRARLGLGRSFQEARLFPDVSLLDTFKIALEREAASETLPSLLGLPPSVAAERRKAIRAEEIIEILGLGPYANRNCGELSTGMRRFAELGCMVAMGSEVVLLDEPTAGIAQREVEAFVPVLREIRDHLGASMVVIDHDIPMLMGLVDRVYVMALGRIIADGPPDVVRSDPAVIAAYLGTDERAIERSGTVARPVAAAAANGSTHQRTEAPSNSSAQTPPGRLT